MRYLGFEVAWTLRGDMGYGGFVVGFAVWNAWIRC